MQVYPDASRKRARRTVLIGNATGKPGRAVLRIAGAASREAEAVWDAKGGRVEVEVDLADDRLWTNSRRICRD